MVGNAALSSGGSNGTVNVEFIAPVTANGFESGIRKWIDVQGIDNEGTGITTDAPLTVITNMVEDPTGTVRIPSPPTGPGSVRSITVNASTGNPSDNVVNEQTEFFIDLNTSQGDATAIRARMGIAEAVELTTLCGQTLSAVSASGNVLTEAQLATVVSKLPCPEAAFIVGDSYNNGTTSEPAALLDAAMPFDVDISLAIGGAVAGTAVPVIQNRAPLPTLGIFARGLNDIAGTTNQDPVVLAAEIEAGTEAMFAGGCETVILATIPPYGEPMNGVSNPGFSAIKPQIIRDTNVLIREQAASNPNILLWEVHDTLADPDTGFRRPEFTINDTDIHINLDGAAATGQVLIDLVDDNFFC